MHLLIEDKIMVKIYLLNLFYKKDINKDKIWICKCNV